MSTPVILLINVAVLVVLGLILRAVPSEPNAKGGFNFNYTTSDLVIMAVLGALAGVVNTWMGNVWFAANSVSPIYGAALQGTFMWAYLLSYFLVRKSGSMLIVGIIEASVEALLGNQAGLSTLGWGITQGLAAEVVMWFANYSKFGWLAFGLAGAGAPIWNALELHPLRLDFTGGLPDRHSHQPHLWLCLLRSAWLLAWQAHREYRLVTSHPPRTPRLMRLHWIRSDETDRPH
jgi:hypothetical protein